MGNVSQKFLQVERLRLRRYIDRVYQIALRASGKLSPFSLVGEMGHFVGEDGFIGW